jgi:hypothetical protein
MMFIIIMMFTIIMRICWISRSFSWSFSWSIGWSLGWSWNL